MSRTRPNLTKIVIASLAIVTAALAQDTLGDPTAEAMLLSSDLVVAGSSVQAQPGRFYVANGASLVTVLLPPAPLVGDVVRVSGAGTGGWLVAQNAGQSIYAANLPGASINDWTARDNNRSWSCIAASGDGAKLVAGEAGGRIYTSSDSGATWTARMSGASRVWTAVASSADGTKLVAASHNDYLFTSADSGATWTARESPRFWIGVASSADGTKLAAAVQGGRIYTSANSGASWTPRASEQAWYSLAMSVGGTRLVAAVYYGSIHTSADSGVTWTVTPSGARPWRSVASSGDGTKLVAAAHGGWLYTSANRGATWTPRLTDANRRWTGVAISADGTKLFAVGYGTSVFMSSDGGATWMTGGDVLNWYAIGSSDGGDLVAGVEYGGQIYTLSGSLTTTIGTTGGLSGRRYSAVELQYAGSGMWMPISAMGTLVPR